MLIKPDYCRSCLGWNWPDKGFVPAHGSGDNGVLIVAEAAGEDEQIEGIPLVGKAGHYFWSNLARVGIEREGFKVHNVLSCRPPKNLLTKMPYEDEVVSKCAPFLDSTIADMQALCRQNGKTFVICTLGRTAFKRIHGLNEKSALLKEDYLNYPIWSQKYGAWCIACDHPSYLMRGNHHLLPVLQYGVQRAVEIARDGLDLETHQYLLDPNPEIFESWCQGYFRALDHDPLNTFLSYDIETPHKQGADEEQVAKEDDDDYTILRCSFSYRPNEAVSVPWDAQHRPMLEELFASDGQKIGWNLAYDSPRVKAQMPINGEELDGMLAWHVLNTSMPKGLGFVTPFYAKSTLMWKHMSGDEPAFYNAKDADMALRNWLGIRNDLKTNDLWKVFDRHVVQLNKVLGYMSKQGVPMDMELRDRAEKQVSALLEQTEQRMEEVVPFDARKLKVYKKVPKDVSGMVQVDGFAELNTCLDCGEIRPKKPHDKLCGGVVTKQAYPEMQWAKPLEFKISKVSLMLYQKAVGHRSIVDRKTGSITFDENAIIKLQKLYQKDPLYPLILEFRGLQKLLSTYIGQTEYIEVEVPDDYELQPGEKLVSNAI